MFKNETLVKASIFSLLLTLSPYSLAADPATVPDACQGFKTLLEDLRKDTPVDQVQITAARTELTKCINKQLAQRDSTDSCRDAGKDYKKARDEFSAACSGIPKHSEEPPGNIACGWTIEKCDCRFKNLDSIRQTTLNCTGNTSSSTGNASGMYDVSGARESYEHCPMLAGSDMDKIEKELKEKQKELRELDRKIPELQQAKAEAQSQMGEKVSQVKMQMAEAAKEHGQQLKEAKRAMEEAQNQLGQQVLQLQEELTKNEEQRGQISLARREAEVRRSETITAIELNCHQQASAQVGKMQGERLVLEQSRQFNRGGFGAMLKEVGLTDRESWQRVAMKYHKWCLQSSPTRKAKESANKMYETALRGADKAELNIDKKREDIMTRIRKIQNKAGCTGGGQTAANGTSAESGMCQALRKAVEDQAQVDQDYIRKRNALIDQQRSAMADGQRKVAAKDAALQRAESEVNDERARLKNLQEFLALKQEMSGGASVDTKDMAKAREKYMVMRGAAGGLVACKTRPDDPQTATPKERKCTEDPDCLQAARYSRLIGEMQAQQWKDIMNALPTGSMRFQDPHKSGEADR